MHGGGAEGIRLRRHLGRTQRLGRLAGGLGNGGQQRLEGEADVGDDRVADRGAGGLVGVAGDRDQRRRRRQAGGRGCSGSRGRPRCRRRGRGRGPRGSARAGRSPAAGRRGSWGGPRGSRCGPRPAPGWPRPAAAAARRARRPRPRRRSRRCRARRPARGSPPPSRRSASSATSLGVGRRRRRRRERAMTCGRVHRRERRRPSRPSGSRRTPGRAAPARRDGCRGRARAARPRRAAARSDHLTSGCGMRVASRLVRFACRADELARLLAGGDQQRRVVGLRVEDRAHRVADPRRRVEVDVRDAPGGLRVAVGHAHGDRLLEPEHVAEVRGEVGEHRQLGRAGVAEDRRHPVLAEKVEGGFANAGHEETLAQGGAPPGPQALPPSSDNRSVLASLIHSRQGGGSPARAFALPAAVILLVLVSLLAGPLAARDAGAASLRSPGPTFISRAPGQIVPIPRDIPHQAGSMIDRRLIPNLRWLSRRYHFYVTEGYAGPLSGYGKVGCPACHVSGSDHHYGLAVDLVAGNLTSGCTIGWRLVTALARWAEPRQNVPVAPFRWVGYNGDSGHGCGHHLHLSWEPRRRARVQGRRLGAAVQGQAARRRRADPAEQAEAPDRPERWDQPDHQRRRQPDRPPLRRASRERRRRSPPLAAP